MWLTLWPISRESYFSGPNWRRVDAPGIMRAGGGGGSASGNPRMQRLTDSLCQVLDDYTMVSFVPLNITDEDSIDMVLMHADRAIQYGEDLEPQEPKDEDEGER